MSGQELIVAKWMELCFCSEELAGNDCPTRQLAISVLAVIFLSSCFQPTVNDQKPKFSSKLGANPGVSVLFIGS